METSIKSYQAVAGPFRDAVVAATNARKFVRLEYLTDLSEFIKADVALRRLYEQDGAEFLEFATGETVRLDRVVSIGGELSPLFPGYANYSCDC
ncbi:hypothetical protein [Spirosoma montaniterrae]|uniref:Uncharacterized protein n=1 Tax=Spirosoma montaniterrae TaxID=1178516 RepID=A0A1P9X171_9BACT|nr:hypothetical protein [Spirosoma montaniterrae]AQG81381.1 hypothetical protein AWR27_19885 [Spirosoma montaniterrae]